MAATASCRRTTHVFATHGIPLACDVYSANDSPAGSPAVLFFHSGGLVDGSRRRVPPWLVQVCHRRRWPLISSSYRLMPQVGAKGLLDDASAAYSFARSWGDADGGRPVIVAGASAGQL